MQDLLTQKDLPEAELRLEVSARLDAERRLRLAQDSVHHLEGALQTDISPSALRTKILPDVKKLRSEYRRSVRGTPDNVDKDHMKHVRIHSRSFTMSCLSMCNKKC